MLQIVVEVADTVCDAGCSIFSQTFDRQPTPTADRIWHIRWAEAVSLAAAENCVYALAVRRRDELAPRG